MEGSLNTALTVSIILISTCIVVFLVFLIQILNIFKRILIKIEYQIDSLELTQEEVKLKILNFLEEIINKIKKYKKIKKALVKKLQLEEPKTDKEGGVKNEKENKE